MWKFIKRILASLCVIAIARGILTFLATKGILTDVWIANALGYATDPNFQTSILWIISGAFGLFVFIFWPEIEKFLRQIVARSPLEIIFDPTNPGRRFWSMEAQKDQNGKPLLPACWQYRVELRNNSSKTLRNVRISAEALGQIANRPLDMPFDKTQNFTIDINPNCSELVTILRWPHPKVQVGMLAGPSALEYGPIKIIASADNVPSKSRIFKFDYQKTPMIFD